jgi:hypothetical protein
MTKANDGKQDTRIQSRDDATQKGNLIASPIYAKATSALLMFGLTIFLACKDQYFYALCSACLSLAAATCERLRKLKIGLHGLHSEWSDARHPESSRRLPRRG